MARVQLFWPLLWLEFNYFGPYYDLSSIILALTAVRVQLFSLYYGPSSIIWPYYGPSSIILALAEPVFNYFGLCRSPSSFILALNATSS